MRVLPADPLGPVGDQQSLAPTPLTPEQQANYYTQGGDESQYRGLAPKVMGYSSGSVAPYRMIVRRPDNRAVVIEQGQTLDLATIQAAPEAGDWAAWFGDSPNPYKSYRGQPDALARMAEQQYEQQFGLPAGGPDTWRGRIAQYMGGNAGYGAVGGAIGGGIAGLVAGGPVGAVIGAVGGAALGGGLGAYSDPNNIVNQESERIAASLGLAEAKDEFDRSVFGALSIFAVPAQWTEQAFGVGSQALDDPYGTASHIGAAWEASRLYYESDPTASLRPGSLTYVDTDMPDITGGVAALVEARRRIAAGEPAEYVIAEMTGRYGVFGQLRDLVVQSALDPSNVIAGAGANRAARTLARVAGATEVLDDAGRVVGYAGRGATLARAADMVQPRGVFQTLAGSGGLKDIAEAYKNLKVMETFRPGFAAARDLNWFQRALIGTDLMQVYSGTYTKPKWYEVFRLTPDALAHDRVVQSNNIMQAMITGRIPLDENFPVRANEIVTQLRTVTGAAADGADEVTRVMASLEGSVLRRALSEGGDVSGDLLKAWRDTRADAAILADMQAKLNMTQGEVLAAAERGWNELLGQYTQAGGVVPEGVNPKVVETTFDLFRRGDVPVSVEEYRAGLMSALTEQAGQWAAKTFDVKPPSLITRLANLNKAAQSTLLLGANPSYPINNVTNNELTMVARGILALRSVDDLVGSLDRLGISPIRMGEGVITGDLVGEVQGAIERWGEQAAEAGFKPLREATTPKDGILERAQRGVSRVGRAMPFMALSQKAESAYSVRAFGSAALDAWSRTWRAGVGFSRLPDSLASTLRTIDPRLPRAIEAAVEAGTHPRDLLDRVFSRLGEVTAGTYMDAAAQRAGLTTEQMQRALSIGNMEQTLNERLAALPEATPEAVRRVFNDVRVEAEAHLSELIANQAKVEYDAAAHFAGDNEGGWVDGGAVAMLMDNMRARQTEAYIEHSKILENIWEEYHRQAIDTDTFKLRLREAGDSLYNNGLFPLMQSNIDGIASAFGKAGSPLPEGFTQLQRSIAMLTQDFHAQKQAALDEFFGLPPKQRTAAAWAETNRIIDDLYDNMTGHVHERQMLMDEYVAAAYEARFPGSGDPVREWRDLIRAHEAQYQEAVREQFELTRQLFSFERGQAWREFHARMIRYRTAWLESEKNARRAAVEFVPGRATLEAEARRLRRPLPVVNQPEVKIPTMAGVSRDDFLKVPRQQLPPEIAEAIKAEASAMLQDATDGTPRYSTFSIGDSPIESASTPTIKYEPATTADNALAGISPERARNVPRSDLPEGLSTAIAQEAQQLLHDLKQGSKGTRQFNRAPEGGPPEVSGTSSSYPDWYGPLKRDFGTVTRALERIIKDKGVDVDKGKAEIVNILKELIIERLAKTDPNTGRPPEPEVMRWLGKSNESEIAAAYEAWAKSGREPNIKAATGDTGPVLSQDQLDTIAHNLRAIEARENLAAGAADARTYRVQMVDDAGVAEVMDNTGRVFEVRTDQLDEMPTTEQAEPPKPIQIGVDYPEWYGRLTRKQTSGDAKMSRQAVLRGLQRIIDGTKDTDKIGQRVISRLKNEILLSLSNNGREGRPPEPEILRWLGEPEEKIQAAIEAWRAIGQEPMIPQYVAGEPMLTQAQVDMLSSNLRVLEARENMAAGTEDARTYRVQMVDDAGVAEVVDDTGRVFEVRTDEPDVEPMLPPGHLAEDGGLPMPIASAQAEMYHQHVRPALEALQTETMAGVERGTLALADNVPEAVQEQIRAYLRAAGDKMGEAKLFATRWGEYKRDSSLLNYSRRYMADTYLGAVAPYQFWATHSMLAWAAETIQRPALLASYYRTRKFLHASVTRRGTPSRLSGRVKFELPFMPEWMGGGVWVDPLNLGLPLEKFGSPWEQVAQSQSRLQDRTEDALTDMLNAGEITRDQYRQALNYRPGGGDDLSGALVQAVGVGMPDAYTEARRRVLAEDPTLRNDVADLAVALFPPSLLLYNAYQTLRGTPERISPLPITRDVRNVTAALGMNNGAGINLEAGVRRAMNLPTFDQWGDYRVDRELANMAAEGIITAEQARAAMLERSGQAYEMAMAREAQQGGANGMVQIFGRLFGGAAVLPEGEMRGRQMQLLLAAAREAQDNGDTGALSEFFEKYPEVEARLALMDDPDGRMTSFLTDQVWAAWRGLPTLYRRQVQQQLGADFSESFLNRQYDGINPDTLATWARTLGRYVPGNIGGDPAELDLAPEPVAYEVQRYYDERAGTWNMDALYPVQSNYFDIPSHERVGLGPVPESVDQFYAQRDDLYPGIGDLMSAYSALPKNSEPAAREQAFPGIGGLLDQYYALPKGTGQRSDFLDQYPQVKAYWDWKEQYKAANPQDGARADFRAANPQLEAYWNWSDQYKAQNPDAAAYMDSNAPRVRDVYLNDHPELVQYWDWRRAWMEAHPEAEAWIKETGQASTGGEDEDEAPAASTEIIGSDAVKGVVEAYLFGGRSLSYAARQAIQPAFEQYGRDGQTLDQYLIEVWRGGGYLEASK